MPSTKKSFFDVSEKEERFFYLILFRDRSSHSHLKQSQEKLIFECQGKNTDAV